MGKISVEESVKELQRVSKKLKRVAYLLEGLSHIDPEFSKKADELMMASTITEGWSEDIDKEFLELDRNEQRMYSE